MAVQQRTRYGLERQRAVGALRDAGKDTGGMQILIVDDHALLRRGLALTIALRFPGTRIHEAGSLVSGVRKAQTLQPLSAVLYDLNLTDAEGLPGLRRMLEAVRPAPLVVISATSDPAMAGECIRAGASGFLPKWCRAEVLEHALPLVLNGGVYAPSAGVSTDPDLAPDPVRGPAPEPSEIPALADTERRARAAAFAGLTERQRDVLQLLVSGQSNKEIARALGVLEGTVKVHVRAIMQQLKVRNRTQVTMAAARAGLFL